MNLYRNSEQELSNRRKKQRQYRQTLEQQIKQKQKLKQSEYRLRTEQQRGSHNTPRIQSTESNSHQSSVTKKNHYQSSFLPSIDGSLRKKNQQYGHKRVSSYAPEMHPIMSQDTDIQTIEALAECDIIIENLRRLRMKSLSSMKRKQMQLKLNSNNSYFNEAYSDRNDNYPRYKQSLAEQEVMMFRAWEPNDKQKKKKDSKKLKNKQIIQLDDEESDEKGSEFEESLIPHTMELQENNNEDFEGSMDRKSDEEGDDHQQEMKNKEEKERQQQQKTLKRQKILLKYLGKAKMRGAKLHEKITNFRNRTINVGQRESIANSRKAQDEQESCKQSRYQAGIEEQEEEISEKPKKAECKSKKK